MYKNLLNCLALILLFPSCTKTPPNISVVCEENNVGNCIIKWEIAPLLQGQVKVYASTHPESIPETTPIAAASISEGQMTIITDNPNQRYYYTMIFADKYRVKVATRNVNIPGIQNFRDLGGYKSSVCQQNVRWGMIYRSAQIDSLRCGAQQELRCLGIKTIIDLRANEEFETNPALEKCFKVVHIPITTGNLGKLLKDIQNETIKGDTLYRIIERINRKLVTDYKPEYKQLFSILLKPDNYPVVIHCSSGKGRTGIVSALILAALGVNEEIIMQDYRLSNYYFNIPKASKYAYALSDHSQEAITTIFSAKEDFLNAAKEEIERKYGNVATYLEKALDLDAEKIKRLRSILLVNND